jgi:hypothetical protein
MVQPFWYQYGEVRRGWDDEGSEGDAPMFSMYVNIYFSCS